MKAKASQDFVPIKEVRDGVVILKDGSLRSILMTSSLNFALKSGEEQKAIIYQYQSFLNSLDFSIQIAVQSRRLDIRPYLNVLENREKEQTNDLMKIQTREYSNFIRTFTESVNIMTKNFFIVIPYSPAILSFKKKSKNKISTKRDIENFEEQRSQLEQRVLAVQQGVMRAGIRATRLGTEEIIEIYYKTFNPGDVGEVALFNE